LRVIAGRFRGRKLEAPRGQTTRPTADRVRQALFDVLGPLDGARVLDLYAGTGALGIEALSRGAARAVFVESDRAALASIRRNLEALGLDEAATVLPVAVERAAKPLRDLGPFDLVLCDPPWAALETALRALPKVLGLDLYGPAPRIVIEHPSARSLEISPPPGLRKTDERRWGDTAVTVFSAKAPANPDLCPT
jgi:16S rRNA (guanine966-N2)-methyltransferase